MLVKMIIRKLKEECREYNDYYYELGKEILI